MQARPLAIASLLALAATPAAAAPPPGLRNEVVWVDRARDLAPDALAESSIAKVIYINRCVDGCRLTPGRNDARSNTSSIVPGAVTLTEFAGTDEDFDAVVSCVRELYAPYDVEITTTDPGPETFHHEAMLAGTSSELGLDPLVGGIAPADCDPLNNVISFSFSNRDPSDVESMCWTVAQESAHSFGLPNHSFDCSDPMTYLGPDVPSSAGGPYVCGRKYFRNKLLPCGEFQLLPCRCGVSGQNSHVQLTTVFGPGTPPAPSTVEILLPAADTAVEDGYDVFFTATNPRQVDHVDLFVNGIRYDSKPGHEYAARNDAYNFVTPDLPDGYQDVEIRAYDDLGTVGSSMVTVLKGEPCSSADTCFPFQSCGDGRCSYPPPSGMLGDTCEYEQFCSEGSCVDHGGDQRCASSCNPMVADSCPDGFGCVEEGACFPEESGGGCCAIAGKRTRTGLPLLGIGLFGALILVLRRRRPVF